MLHNKFEIFLLHSKFKQLQKLNSVLHLLRNLFFKFFGVKAKLAKLREIPGK